MIHVYTIIIYEKMPNKLKIYHEIIRGNKKDMEERLTKSKTMSKCFVGLNNNHKLLYLIG